MGTYSKLHNYTYQKLKNNFPEFTIRENIHPDWLVSSRLTRLELDLFIEEINTAIEVQGEQHYRFVPYFHGDHDGYKKRLQFDQEKRDLCYGKGVRLVEIGGVSDVDIFINDLMEKRTPENKSKYSYSEPGLDKVVIAEIKKLRDEKKTLNIMTRKELAIEKTKQATEKRYINTIKSAIQNKEHEKALIHIIRYERKGRVFSDEEVLLFKTEHELEISKRIDNDKKSFEIQKIKEANVLKSA